MRFQQAVVKLAIEEGKEGKISGTKFETEEREGQEERMLQEEGGVRIEQEKKKTVKLGKKGFTCYEAKKEEDGQREVEGDRLTLLERMWSGSNGEEKVGEGSEKVQEKGKGNLSQMLQQESNWQRLWGCEKEED